MSARGCGQITQSFVLPGNNERQERDKISVSSSRIKQNIKKTLYSAFADQKAKGAVSKLSEMQAKAQLDALKRFIQSMESEVMDKKHRAQEQRHRNQKFDNERKARHETRKSQTLRIESDNREANQTKATQRRTDLERSRAIPDILGDEGYPRIKELNKEERKDKLMKENEFIANALQAQMDDNRKRKE